MEDASLHVMSTVSKWPPRIVPAMSFASIPNPLRVGEGIEGHLHAFVADGVEADLKAGVHAVFSHLGQLGFVVSWQA